MSTTYTTSQAARLAQVSPASVRNYTRDKRLLDYFSPDATVTGDRPRKFTTDDVRLLAFIADRTRNGETLADVVAELERGALSTFQWQAPAKAPQRPQEAPNGPESGDTPQEAPQSPTTALQTLTAFAQALQVEFQASRQREQELSDALIDAERRAATAEAELAAIRSRRGFWARLFGR